MKRFWLIFAHSAVVAAGAAGVILVPGAAPLILPAVGAINGMIPSFIKLPVKMQLPPTDATVIPNTPTEKKLTNE